MQNWWQIAHESMDILTVCLAKGIDQAMVAQCGNDWFSDFAQADAKEKVNMRITKPGQQSVQDLDLQGLLKLLRYRNHLTRQVLSYFRFFAGMDDFSADSQMQQLNGLLDRLITDFRNRIAAHARAADIEKELSGKSMDRIYGYEEAYQDMYKLARIFSDVVDSSGVSYSHRMAALTEKKKKRLPLFLGIATAVLALTAGLFAWLSFGATKNTYQGQPTPEVVQGEVSIQPLQVSYDGDELVAVCHVVNGTDREISDIDVCSLRLTVRGRDLAAANFGILNGVTLAPGESIKWQFRFQKETVFIYNAYLPDLQLQASCNHS